MEQTNKRPLVILTGPTAVGKTAASIGLAKAIGGEIISADSMQVYKEMDIGSAKIRPEEMDGVPHHLVDAFKSTLEEAKYADIILHVVDASNPQMDEQMYTVYETLQNLGVKDKPVITVFNKIDRMEDTWVPRDLRADYHVKISAKTGEGITGFLQSIEAVLRERKVEIEALYPYKEAGKIQKIRKYGELQEEEYREDGIFVRAFVPAELYGQVRPEGVTPNNCL